MAPADNPRYEGAGGVVQEFIDQGGLPRKDDWEQAARVEIRLCEGMELDAGGSPAWMQICLRSSIREPEVATMAMTQYCEGRVRRFYAKRRAGCWNQVSGPEIPISSAH